MQGSRSVTVGSGAFLDTGRCSSCGLRRRRDGGTVEPRWRRGSRRGGAVAGSLGLGVGAAEGIGGCAEGGLKRAGR